MAGFGVTNVMVMFVLERRGGIGLRRAMSARRADIAIQFLGESVVVAVLGVSLGIVPGLLVTIDWASWQGHAALAMLRLGGVCPLLPGR